MLPRSYSLILLIILLVSCKSLHSKHNSSIVKETQTSLGDTVKQLGNQIWYIFQDSKNNYWFSSNGQGVFRFDGKNILNFTKKHGLSSDTTRQIQEDKLGNIYISTFGGINKFDGQKISTLEIIKTKEWKSSPDDMWFALLGKKNENGPYRYDGKNLYNIEFPKHYLHDEFIKSGINPFFSPYEVYTIYKDRKGHMWFGTSIFGACRFDGESIKWMYEKDLTIVPAGGSFGIRSIFEDRDGQFWMCNTWNRYVFKDAETTNSDRLKYKKVPGIGNAAIFDGDEYIYYSHIIEDKNGHIWLTTWSQGVYKYDGTNITHYIVKDGTKDINLVSMYQDKQGDLWLGTPENGVFKLMGDVFERFIP